MTTTASPRTTPGADSTVTRGVDPRGTQLAAGITAAVLVAVLLLPQPAATALLAVQAGLFGLGALRGVHATPHAWLFRTVVRPRLSALADGTWEAPEPPRFAQAVGLAFALVGLACFASGAVLVAQVAIGAALVAALLNAVFAFCLGCEVYLLLHRLRGRLTA